MVTKALLHMALLAELISLAPESGIEFAARQLSDNHSIVRVPEPDAMVGDPHAPEPGVGSVVRG